MPSHTSERDRPRLTARPLAFRAARRLGRAIRLRALVQAVDRRLPHRRRVFPYRGFALVHSRGNTLVERIRAQGDYEPELTAQIANELHGPATGRSWTSEPTSAS